MDLRSLAAQNPWWSEPVLIKNDAQIRNAEESRFKWVPKEIAEFDWSKDRVYTLRGPRQVGKTTLLKLVARKMIVEEKRDPRSVLYFSCDSLTKGEDLVQVLRIYGEFAGRYSLGRCVLLIDEVSSIKGWERSIKLLADNSELKGRTIVLTGSHSLDIRRSSELLPGRRGEGKGTINRLLLPMTFSEYAVATDPRLKDRLAILYRTTGTRRMQALSDLCEGRLDPKVRDALMLCEKELVARLDGYLSTGGIVRAMSEYRSGGGIQQSTYELYVRSLMGDLMRWRFQENITKQVLRAVVDKMTTRISLNSIVKETEIRSRNTVSSYIEALEESFVLNSFYQMSGDGPHPKYRSAQKVYFKDPFLYHAVRGWLEGGLRYGELASESLQDPVEKSRLVEMIVGEHLVRLSYHADPSDVFSHHERVMFSRSKKNDRETDFVVRRGREVHPVEVKYKESVGRSDLSSLFQFGHGVLVSKNDFDEYNRYSTVPAWAFLMLV